MRNYLNLSLKTEDCIALEHIPYDFWQFGRSRWSENMFALLARFGNPTDPAGWHSKGVAYHLYWFDPARNPWNTLYSGIWDF